MSGEGRSPSAIAKSIEPLAAWYRRFKPEVKRLVVSHDDFARLMESTKKTLDRNGFALEIVSEVVHIRWKEFRIVRKAS